MPCRQKGCTYTKK